MFVSVAHPEKRAQSIAEARHRGQEAAFRTRPAWCPQTAEPPSAEARAGAGGCALCVA